MLYVHRATDRMYWLLLYCTRGVRCIKSSSRLVRFFLSFDVASAWINVLGFSFECGWNTVSTGARLQITNECTFVKQLMQLRISGLAWLPLLRTGAGQTLLIAALQLVGGGGGASRQHCRVICKLSMASLQALFCLNNNQCYNINSNELY